MYGGYLNVFVEAFGEEGERWDLFRVVEGEFPELEDLPKYDGFVVSGSPYDAYGNQPWILKLCFLLQILDSMAKKVLECHQDEVLEVPIGANVIGYSEKTGVEMFMLESHILGIQGHPEYTIDILNNLIDRLLIDQFIQEDLAENAKNMLERTEPDRKCLVKICRKFLKGR
uniref:Glutamine amidotransferase domain-containing protein n=1 Tax=Cannabis sativa TaxID=3483 RepID=A0A803QAU0_CANSA